MVESIEHWSFDMSVRSSLSAYIRVLQFKGYKEFKIPLLPPTFNSGEGWEWADRVTTLANYCGCTGTRSNGRASAPLPRGRRDGGPPGMYLVNR